MYKKNPSIVVIAVVIGALLISVSSVFAREQFERTDRQISRLATVEEPSYCLAGHRVGKIELGITNNGTFGTNYFPGLAEDCFTGHQVPSCEYPKGSNATYLYGATFWIGAVVGRDTLVSEGADGWSRSPREFSPDAAPFGDMIKRSIIDPTVPEYDDAISEEDYICVYTDTIKPTVSNDPDYFGRAHIPLNIQVTERSFAWSYQYAEDLVLFDYKIKNIGFKTLTDVYMGIYVDADICFDCANGYTDDLCGFVRAMPSPLADTACHFIDTVNIAWTADNDGDFGLPPEQRVPHLTATRIVRTPNTDSLGVSFNWWVSNGTPILDFGPRHRFDRFGNPPRDLKTGGLGTPEGDVNKYAFMSNREFDFDQAFSAVIQPTDTLWMPVPPDQAPGWADGLDTRYLLSFGPFDINPQQVLPLSFAYLAGEDFHTIDGNLDHLPNDPFSYYEGLDFTDLGKNAVWASWIYDNPGVDTDGNGYFGQMRFCLRESVFVVGLDTIWNEDSTAIDAILDGYLYTKIDTSFASGDGEPDFKGASPPPAPAFNEDPRKADFTLTPFFGGIHVRFNGLRSETTRDNFSGEYDFEGYRVHLARDARASSYSVIDSYDREDYNKYIRTGANQYVLREIPFSRAELRCLYGDRTADGGSCGDANFNPLSFTRSSPYHHPDFPDDSIFYFESQDFNASELGVNTKMRKTYPSQPYPSNLDPSLARPDELTETGHLKYFEYKMTIPDLLPGVEWWVSITAFDFGSPQSGLPSLESSVTVNALPAYPLDSWDKVQQDDLKVYVYPNPYRIDADYRGRGLEGRLHSDRPPDRVRRINFANLPPKCTIRIYTIDGDLVRKIDHDVPLTDPRSIHAEWDMITRNTQMIVSGLYYWVVEDDKGNTQIGKLSIVM